MRNGFINIRLLAENTAHNFFLIFFLKSKSSNSFAKIPLTKYHIQEVAFSFLIANPPPLSKEIVKRQFKPMQPPVEGYSFKWKWTFRETSYSMCWVLSARSRNSQLELCSTPGQQTGWPSACICLFYAISQFPKVCTAASIHFTSYLAVPCL